MKTTNHWRSAALLALTGAATIIQAQERQPNIIMFLVDDMGWQDTSVPFHSDTTNLNRRFRTPGMEKLAQMGVCFTEAYACPVSSPSRCSLMSGMNAARHRVTNWTRYYNQKTDAGSQVINVPEWNYNGIQPEGASDHDLKNGTEITALPKILKENGYYTIHCGKAHFGAEDTQGADPSNFGFDVNIAGGPNGAPGSYLGLENFGNPNSQQAVKGLDQYHGQDVFLTDVLTDEAIKALETPIARKQPFYLYMSHYAVHSPYSEDKNRTPHYRGLGNDPQLNVPLNESEIRYAAIVEGMDASLMRLIEFVETLPQEERENTVILFMSDNGGQALNNVRQGVANRDQNYPARAGKGSAFLGGVKEPMIVSWPAKIQGNTRTDQRVMIEDFFSSILDIAGVEEYQTVQTVDGQSFKNVLLDAQQTYDRPIYWHFPNLWGETQDKEEGYGAVSAILKDDMHLIYTWETQTLRLYNIKEDIGEQNDLAAQQPEVVKELAKELTDYLKSCDAQRPSYKSTGREIPWPDEVVAVGEAMKISNDMFQLSTDEEKHYYLIADRNNASTQVGGAYYWTQGAHYGGQAIQANASILKGTEIQKQLFYFVAGKDEQHVQIMTYAGEPVGYVEGTTSTDWNNGNPDQASQTVRVPYLQYGAAPSDSTQFQIHRSSENGYYGISSCDTLLGNWGAGQGLAGAADMKWVVGSVEGLKGEVLSEDNSCRFYFMPYDENSFTTYYKEALVTESDQIADGDFVVLQNVTDDSGRQGYVQFATNQMVTVKNGVNQTALSFAKSTFDGNTVFRIKKDGEQIRFMNAAGSLYLPNNTANGNLMVPTADAANAAYTLEKNTQKDFAWNIKTAGGNAYLNGNDGSPTLWTSAHPYLIYKVSQVAGETTETPWFYLSALKADAGRTGRTMQVGNDQGNEKRLWTAPTMTNTVNQLWHLEESYGKVALVSLSDPEHGVQGVPESGANSADAKYVYSSTAKDFSFLVATGDVNEGGIPLVTIKRANADGWYLNASQSGKQYDVNEYSDPNSGKAGYWAPVAAAQLFEVDGQMAVGSFSAPYAVTLPEEVDAYVATEVVGEYLHLEAFDGKHLPANTPVILKAEVAGYYPMKQTAANTSVAAPADNLLLGTGYSAAYASADNSLVIRVQDAEAVLAPADGRVIPALQAYYVSEDGPIKYLDFDGTATGIGAVETASEKDEVYDLSGRRVTRPSQGVYISKGKKFIAQ